MTEQPTCPRPRCDRPIHDQGYICVRCGGSLAHELRILARLAGEGRITIAGLDRIRAGARRTDPNPALPVDLAAAADHDAAVSTLLTWARHIQETSGRPLPDVPADQHPTAVLAEWLTHQVDWLRHRPEADEAFDELFYACSLLQRVVDRPADRWYAGQCDLCRTGLYPPTQAKTIRCGECGWECDVDERKAALLERVEDAWAIPEQIAHTLTALGVKCTSSMVRGYARRGRLAPHPELSGGRRRYRIGSVRELVDEQREQERLARLRRAVRDAEEAEARRRAQPSCLTA